MLDSEDYDGSDSWLDIFCNLIEVWLFIWCGYLFIWSTNNQIDQTSKIKIKRASNKNSLQTK
jgi:hypothetical protein